MSKRPGRGSEGIKNPISTPTTNRQKSQLTAQKPRAASTTASSGGDEDTSLLSELRHILDDLKSGAYTAKDWDKQKQEPRKGSLNKVGEPLQSLRQHIKRLYSESMHSVQAVRNHLIDIKQCVDQDDYEIDTSAKAGAKGSNMRSKDTKKKDEEVDEDEMTKRDILNTLSTFSKKYKSLKRLEDEVLKWKQSACGPRVIPNQKQRGQTKSGASKAPVPVTPKEESGEEAFDALHKKIEISMSGLREKLKIEEKKVTQLHINMKKLEDQCRGRQPSKGSEGSEQFDEQKCIESLQGVIEERNRLKQLEEHFLQWESSFHPSDDSKPNDPKEHKKHPSNSPKRKPGNKTPVPTGPVDRSGEKVIQLIKTEVEREKEKLREKAKTAEESVVVLHRDMMYLEGQCSGRKITERPEQYDKQKCIDSVLGIIENRKRIDESLQELEHEVSTQKEQIFSLVDQCGDQQEKVPGRDRDWHTQLHILLNAIEERSSFRENIKTLQKRQKSNDHELEWKNKEIARLEKEKSSIQADFEKDKKHLMLRLSKMAGAKLTDNNPNIADLSDPDRAVKMAERFSEIYDNQWTEAYECLDQHKWKDIDMVRFLYSSLLDAYTFCVDVSDNQMAVLKYNLVCPVSAAIETKGTSEDQPDLSTLHRKALSDLRKENKESSIQDVKRRYVEKRKADGMNGLEFPIVETYITECVDVCWRMMLLSPRVYIETEDMDIQKIVKEKYKLYTKSGSKIDYVVWPALYLHKDGPILQKGVVQPK